MRQVLCITLCLAAVTAAGCAGLRRESESPFDAPISDQRPRVFIRRHGTPGYEGLTVGRLRERAHHPEYARRRYKMKRGPLGRALEWMIDGRREDLEAAVAGLRKMGWKGGNVSERGMNVVRLAALYDWVRDELDDDTRQTAAGRIEEGADYFAEHIRQGGAPFFYSRTPGALAAVTVAGIALKGDSAKADEYLELARTFGPDELFQAFDWVDGAATGGRYTIYYTYPDLGHVLAAWWSATGRNPTAWIRRHRGAWLDDAARFHLWYIRPGVSFTDANDQRMSNWNVKDQYSQGLDLATYLTRDGRARSLSLRWNRKCGVKLYHSAYIHNFIFWDPTVRPEPLADLPRAALFGRESCGYAFFRSSWPKPGEPDDAAHVFFRAGDPINVHGSVTAGQFQIFRNAELAARGSKYTHPYDCPRDQYHRNAASTNVVLFTDPAVEDDRGDQLTRLGMKTNHRTWDEWLAIRRRNEMDVARITDWQVAETEARCRADLSKTNPASNCKTWIRELVWLGYEHLVVLDVVETARPDIERRWQLHLGAAPTFGDRLMTVVSKPPKLPAGWVARGFEQDRRAGKLFCRTLLPRNYRIVLHDGEKARTVGPGGAAADPVAPNPHHLKFGGHVAQVVPAEVGTRTVFLHVLTAADGDAPAPGEASWRLVRPGLLEVTVGGQATRLRVPHWFKP